MDQETAPQVFISYSRKDSERAEKLAANLLAQGFAPWVDRERIEGGDDWERKIRDAIASSVGYALILTPDAAESKWVAREFSLADDLTSSIQMLLYQPVERIRMPLGWGAIQQIDMRGDYGAAIQLVAKALRRGAKAASKSSGSQTQRPRETQRPGFRILERLLSRGRSPGSEPQLPPEEVERLYREAVRLLEHHPRASGDLEKAARLLQDIVDDNPRALRDSALARLKAIQPELKTARIRELAQAIGQANATGDWRQEYALWNALSSFGKLTTAESDRLQQAKHNQSYQDVYNVIIGMVADGSYSAAAADLEQLWTDTRDYGDTAGLARILRSHNVLIYTTQEKAEEAERQRQLADARAKAKTEEAEKLRRLSVARAATTSAADGVAQIVKRMETIARRATQVVDEAVQAASRQNTPEALETGRKAGTVKDTVARSLGAVTTKSSIAAQAARTAQSVSDPQEAESAQRRAELAESEARETFAQAERITADVESELSLNRMRYEWTKRKTQYEQEMRTVSGYVEHVFEGSLVGVWGAAASLFIGLSALAAVISHSLIVAGAIVAGLTVLVYAAYRRMVHWAAFMVIVLLSAAGVAILVPLSMQLTVLPIHTMAVVGTGVYSIQLSKGASLIDSSAATWALICGPIGLIAGMLIAAAFLSDRSSDKKSIGCGGGLSIVAVAALFGVTAGGLIGVIFGAALAFPVLKLGWLYGGLVFGAVVGVISSTSVAHGWPLGVRIVSNIGVLVAIALAVAAPFVLITGQSVESIAAWSAGLVLGGIISVGLVLLVVIVSEVRRPHPFPEQEPTITHAAAPTPAHSRPNISNIGSRYRISSRPSASSRRSTSRGVL